MKNQKVLEDFEKGLLRDKSNDVIDYNFLKNNKRLYDEIMCDFFNRRIKDLFNDYLDRMNCEEDEVLFVEGLNKKLKLEKCFKMK